MTGPASERGLRILLTIMSFVMVAAGSFSVLIGASSVPREGHITADVDSEMRFFAVWYVVAGVVLLRATRNIASETPWQASVAQRRPET